MATKIRATTQINFDGNLNIGAKLTNVTDPTSAQDAATKNYVDAKTAGLDWKQSVRVATVGSNITLSGPQTLDGVSVIAGDRVLVKNQSAPADNGIYVCASGAWARSTDANTSALVTSGMAMFVSEGTANAGTNWILTTPDPIVLGTTALTFTQFGAGSTYSAGDTSLTLSGTAFKVTPGTNGQVEITSSGVVTPVTLSGAVASVGNTGVVTLDGTVAQLVAGFADSEVPSGTINGSNVTFTFAHTPTPAASLRLFQNGIRLTAGGTDYVLATATITMVAAPITGDTLIGDYRF